MMEVSIAARESRCNAMDSFDTTTLKQVPARAPEQMKEVKLITNLQASWRVGSASLSINVSNGQKDVYEGLIENRTRSVRKLIDSAVEPFVTLSLMKSRCDATLRVRENLRHVITIMLYIVLYVKVLSIIVDLGSYYSLYVYLSWLHVMYR